MKLVIILFFISTWAVAQNNPTFTYVQEFLGQERYSEMVQSNPGLINDLSDRVNYGFQLIEMIPEKSSDFKPLNEIKLNFKEGSVLSNQEFVNLWESGDFNPLFLDLPQSKTENAYIHLVGTDRALIIYSLDAIQFRRNQK